jgi:hypothetical protein
MYGIMEEYDDSWDYDDDMEEYDIGWDWCDDRFCHDNTEWDEIKIEDMFEGIGRLLYETQYLTEIILLWYAKCGNIFEKDWKNSEEYNFTRTNIESCKMVQDIRDQPLGFMINKISGVVKFGFKKDEEALRRILSERNYFVHEFYAKCLSGRMNIDDFNKACRRLKLAISTVVKFNHRNIPAIRKDIKRLGEQSNVPLHTPASQLQKNKQ